MADAPDNPGSPGSSVPAAPSQTPDQPPPIQGGQLFAQPSSGDKIFGSSGGVNGAQLFAAQPKSYLQSAMTGQTPLSSSSGTGMGQVQAPSVSSIPDLEDIPGGSMVKKGMAVLDYASYPSRLAMMAETAGAAAIGVPGAQELYQKLNPTNSLFPNPHYHDVSDFVIDKAAQESGADQWGPVARGIIATTKVGVGMVADMAHDPLMYLGIGEYTEGAQALQKIGAMGEEGSQARNILSLHIPFTDVKNVPILSGEQVTNAANAVKSTDTFQALSQGADRVMSIPGVQAAAQAAQSVASIPGKIVRALSPNTGFQDVDYAANTYKSLENGRDANIINGYIADVKKMNFTSDEAKMIGELGENVSNLKPNIPDSVLAPASGKFVDEATLRQQTWDAMEAAEKKLGTPIAAGRDNAIVDGVVQAKMSDARDLENKFKAGQFDAKSDVLENHLPHVMDPKYIGNGDAERAQAWAMNKEKSISSGQISRQRSLLGTVSEINQAVKEKFGIDKLFMEDPFAATATREARSQKLLRDTTLLDSLTKYGVPVNEAPKGYLPIHHASLEGNGLVYPPEIATKMGYLMGAKSPGNLQGTTEALINVLKKPIQIQNKLVRMQVFTSPGIWIRNGLDNLIKGMVYGVGPDAWRATHEVLSGAFKGEQSAGNLLNPSGKFWSGADIKNMLDTYGVSKGMSFREGLSDYADAARESLLSQKQGIAKYAENAKVFANGAMNFVASYGEKAEKFTRAAFMYQKVIKEGYEPAAAADLMTRVLFDYTRNSPVTDAARFFSPFIQHPIKSALSAPMLVGKNPGIYNAIHNEFPKILANAMSDPMQTRAFNQIAPDYIKKQDAIAGPTIGQNSWLANIFGKSSGPAGTQTYLTPGLGMSILNHLTNPGLNPTFQALINFVRGSNPGKTVGGIETSGMPIPGSEKWNALFWQSVSGTAAMPNLEKSIKQVFGLGNPQTYEPQTVYLMRAATSQFGGGIDLDHDAHVALTSLAYAYKDLQKSGAQQLSQEKQGLGSPSSYSTYMNVQYGPIVPSTNAEIYADTQKKLGLQKSAISSQEQQTSLAQQFADHQLDAGQYAARLKNIEQNIKSVNQAVQFSYQRYLQMSSGAKPGQDARAAAGVKLNPTVNQISR